MRLNTNTNILAKIFVGDAMRCAGMRHEVNLWTHKNRWAHAAQFVYPGRASERADTKHKYKYKCKKKITAGSRTNERRRRLRCDLLCGVWRHQRNWLPHLFITLPLSIALTLSQSFDFDTYLCALYMHQYVDQMWICHWPLGCSPKRLKTIAAQLPTLSAATWLATLQLWFSSGWVIPFPTSLDVRQPHLTGA